MAETLWCANCGSAIHSTDRFCFQCGAENGHSVVPGGPETPPSNAWPFADTQTMPVAADAPFPAPFGPPVSPASPEPNHGHRGLTVAGLMLVGIAILGAGGFVGIRLVADSGTTKAHPTSTAATQLSAHPATPTSTASTKTAPASKAPTPTDFAALYAQASSGVVSIETIGCSDQGVGTGFLLSPTLVATVHHVIADSAVISLIAGKQRTTGTVIGSDPSTDLALVRANRPLTGYHFQLAGADPAIGSRVAAIGFPIGDPITLTVGDISGLDRNINVGGNALTGLIQTDTRSTPATVADHC
jgi:hypothetical protein